MLENSMRLMYNKRAYHSEGEFCVNNANIAENAQPHILRLNRAHSDDSPAVVSSDVSGWARFDSEG